MMQPFSIFTGNVYTSIQSVKIMTSASSVNAVKRQTTPRAMTSTPLLETLITSRNRRLETFTMQFVSNKSMSKNSQSRDKFKTPFTNTTPELTSHVNSDMTHATPEHRPTNPSNKPITTTHEKHEKHEIWKDEDWKASVIIVSVLMVGMIVFVVILHIRGYHRDRLASNRKLKVTSIPLIRVSADET